MNNFYSYHNHKLSNSSSVAQAYYTTGGGGGDPLPQQSNAYNNNSYSSSSYSHQRNDGEVEGLQKRLMKARALNLLYKQQVAKSILSNNSTYASSDKRSNVVGDSSDRRSNEVGDSNDRRSNEVSGSSDRRSNEVGGSNDRRSNEVGGSSDRRSNEVGGSKPKWDEGLDHHLQSEVGHTEAASSMNHRHNGARSRVDDDTDNDNSYYDDHSIQNISNLGQPLNNNNSNNNNTDNSDDDHHVDAGVVVRSSSSSNQARNKGHDDQQHQQPVPMTPHENIVSSVRHVASRSNHHEDNATSDNGDNNKNRFHPYDDHDNNTSRRRSNMSKNNHSSSSIWTGNDNDNDDVKSISINSKKTLQEATDKLKAAIEDNSIYLNKQVYERQEKEQKKKIERQRIDRILSSEEVHSKMPLWRHVLEGRHHPPKDTILRGVRLWKAITRVLIQIVCRPCLLILKNKLRIKAREMRDYSETLNIIAGSMDEWLSKLVQLPIASIVQEKDFQFDPGEVAFNAQPLRIRMLQLKVRFRAIVLNIASSDMPSETITSFLSTLIEDGSYYGDILWPFEEQQLAFDSLSATRQMIIEVHHHDDGDGGDNNDHDVHNNDLDGDAGDNVRDKHDDNGHNPSDLIELRLVDPTVTDNTHATINIRRVRLILQNFIFIRVLINHLILSPWNYNICPKPKNRHTKRAITNYRIMASVVYEFLRSMDGNVPPIIQKVSPSKHNSFIHVSGVSNNDISDADHSKNKIDGAVTMNAGNISSMHSSTTKGGGGGGGRPPTGLMYRLSSLLGMSDTTPGEQIWSSDSIEMQLLGMRPTYTSLRHIHNRMYPIQSLLPIKNLLSTWFSEVIEPVKGYMNKLIVHVLKIKYAKMKEGGMKEQLTGQTRWEK